MPENTPTDSVPTQKVPTPSTAPSASMLGDILHDISTHTPDTVSPSRISVPTPEDAQVQQKIKKPMDAGLFFRFIGAIFIVALIFFGSFLGYIVFNPSQAQFFNNFGISILDVQRILLQLVNIVFGVITFIISISWIWLLFRAIWTPAEYKRKKTLSWLGAVFTGIILFGTITLWAVLASRVNATDYANPNGSVLIYDADLIGSRYDRDAMIYDTTNMIWPIRIKFDISTNARYAREKMNMQIEQYILDFDGAVCTDGTSIVRGTNAENEKTIICTFDTIKTYIPKWEYTWKNSLTRENMTMDIPLPSIDIRGLVDIKRNTNFEWKTIVTLDATKIRATIGDVTWDILSVGDTISRTTPTITEKTDTDPKYVCIKVLSGGACDRIFILKDDQSTDSYGQIRTTENNIDPLNQRLEIVDMSVNINELAKINWLIDTQVWACENSTSLVCEYKFSSYGKHKIEVTIVRADGNSVKIFKEVDIYPPILLVKRWTVRDGTTGAELNPSNTYDTTLNAFVIKNLSIPSSILLDARDIVPQDNALKLKSVVWEISSGKTTEKRIWENVQYDISSAGRHTIRGVYTFENINGVSASGTQISVDTIILDIERKRLNPILTLSQTSDYAPTIVAFDASASESVAGQIKKFIYDFGEGKLPVEGDAKQTYEYISPGEKKISLTIVNEGWERASIEKIIVLKNEPRVVRISQSMTPIVAGASVDMDSAGSNGQIAEYIWDYGDGTPAWRGDTVTHIYTTAGRYILRLTVVYGDGTRTTETRDIEVVSKI